jgi:hypothetical protein
MPNRPPREAAPREREKADKESQQAGEYNERMLAEMANIPEAAWIWEPPIRERLAGAVMALYEGHYAATKNPAFVWYAHQVALEVCVAAPPWVDQYLAEVTAQLVKLVNRPPPRDVSNCIAAALGFDPTRGPGETSEFTHARLTIRDINLTAQVMSRVIHRDDKETEAIADVATKNRLGDTTVGNAFRRLKAKLQ